MEFANLQYLHQQMPDQNLNANSGNPKNKFEATNPKHVAGHGTSEVHIIPCDKFHLMG